MLSSPTPATALVTCGFNSGSAVIGVSIGQATDLPELSISPTTAQVVVSGTGVPDPSLCRTGLPETNKVVRIDVVQPGANQDGTVAIHTDVPFGPGAGGGSPEGAGAAEIEINVDLGSGYDVVDLLLGDGRDEVRLGALAGGSSGVNLNAGAEPVDADGDDIAMSGVDAISVFAGPGGEGNVVDGRGGPEFAGPVPLGMSVAGSEGDDELSAGSAGSNLAGNGGNDTLRGGPGNDTLRGNAGRDAIAYDGAAGGVTVNLTTAAPQNTGGAGVDTLDHADNPPGDTSPDIEDLTGSPFADVLVGSDAANLIVGGEGTDTIAALDGADDVRVDDGVGGDTADCGPGADSARADALGTAPLDALTNCEAAVLVDRTPPPGPGDPGPAGGGGSGGERGPSDGGGQPDTTAPQLRLSLKKRQKLGSIAVGVACLNEPCTVRGSGTVRIAGTMKKRPLRSRPLPLAQGTRGILRFKLPPRTKRAALSALRNGRRVSATVTVRASDTAGNATTQRRVIMLR